jgi:hypothetical protein
MADAIELPDRSPEELIASPGELGPLMQQMHGLVEPAAVGWWPPAPGWWIVALLTITAVAILLRWFVKGRRTRPRTDLARAASLNDQASGLLEQHFARWRADGDTQQYLMGANQTLKRLALSLPASRAIASLSGSAWVDCLEQLGGEDIPRPVLLAISEQSYQPHPSVDAEEVHQALRRWIQSSQWQHGSAA